MLLSVATDILTRHFASRRVECPVDQIEVVLHDDRRYKQTWHDRTDGREQIGLFALPSYIQGDNKLRMVNMLQNLLLELRNLERSFGWTPGVINRAERSLTTSDLQVKIDLRKRINESFDLAGIFEVDLTAKRHIHLTTVSEQGTCSKLDYYYSGIYTSSDFEQDFFSGRYDPEQDVYAMSTPSGPVTLDLS